MNGRRTSTGQDQDQSRDQDQDQTQSRDPEAGTTTAEYAIGTLAACAFAAVLYKTITSAEVASLLAGLVHKALGTVG